MINITMDQKKKIQVYMTQIHKLHQEKPELSTQITNSNIEFIKDIYESCTDYYKVKIQQLIDWHKAYHHPFIVERSYKVHIPTNKINNNRFAVFIDLDSFLTRDGYIIEKKWFEFSTIIKMPIQIEKKCINYMIKREEQVDFIWGLDPLEEKEKMYMYYIAIQLMARKQMNH